MQRHKLNDLEPLLRIKQDNKDVVRSLQELIFKNWEEKYDLMYLKQKEAKENFDYQRETAISHDRAI